MLADVTNYLSDLNVFISTLVFWFKTHSSINGKNVSHIISVIQQNSA